MAKYIDADALKAVLVFSKNTGDMLASDMRKILQEIDLCPAADVEPVRHGRWIVEEDRYNHWHCSECGYVIGVMKMDALYCPRCGAKLDRFTREMEGEDESPDSV